VARWQLVGESGGKASDVHEGGENEAAVADQSLEKKRLSRVAGVDISFLKGSSEHACASIVVLEFPSMRVLYEAFTYVSLPAPYIAGFLAFREVPALTKLYHDLVERCPGRKHLYHESSRSGVHLIVVT
jgi:deoxyinosine 3'endonuclease (endonuclease V)